MRRRYGSPDFRYKITMMDPRVLSLGACLLACLGSSVYGQRDILTPFRNPQQTVPMPEPMAELFRQLQIMQNTAENIGPVRLDDQGREISDHPRWKAAYEALRKQYVDPGFLSYVLRHSGSVEHRNVAL